MKKVCNNYAIEWDETNGVSVKGTYRAGATLGEVISTNDINVDKWGGKIEVPYKYAGTADIIRHR